MKEGALVITDTHCGHKHGLTPMQYQIDAGNFGGIESSQYRRAAWDWFCETADLIGEVDWLIHVGDAIDGKESKSAKLECFTHCPIEQTDMAAAVMNRVKAKHVVIAYGTPYHVDGDTKWETLIERSVKNLWAIKNHPFITLGGAVVDIKHKIGTGSLAFKRDIDTNRDNSECGQEPLAKIFLRGHLHYYEAHTIKGRKCINLPAMQGHTDFGARNVSRHVDTGMVYIEVEDGSIRTQYLPFHAGVLEMAKLPNFSRELPGVVS